MRVSSALAILILGAGVAPSVALPLRTLPKIPGGRTRRPLPDPPAHAPAPAPPPPPPPQSVPKPLPKPPSTVPAPPPPPPSLPRPLPNPPPPPPPPPPSSLQTPQPPTRQPRPLPLLPPQPREPLRRQADLVEPAPVLQRSALQKLVGKLQGRTLIADDDDVVGQLYSRRELLERVDELIMLSARAYEYEGELPTTPMDNLD